MRNLLSTCLVWTSVLLVHPVLGADSSLPSGVEQVGRIKSLAIKESSGITPSRFDSKLFWTHNDGRNPTLYLIDREGNLHGTTHVAALLNDWEDIATDYKGKLYLGDIGNNNAAKEELQVLEVEEPKPGALPRMVHVTRSWKLKFPKEPFDCESLFVWEGYGYVISKVFNDAKATVYRFPLSDQQSTWTLEKVGRLKVDSPVTGASLSSDGKRLGFVCKSGAGVISLSNGISSVGETKPFLVKLKHDHIEGCCFVPEGLLTTAESHEIFLFSAQEFRSGP